MADKRLILAVAGSGKTRLLVEKLNLTERFLVVTYTNTSTELLKNRIAKKYGYIPKNIKVYTYFDFVYNFCLKPFIQKKYKPKGIYWEQPPEHTISLKRENPLYYITKSKLFYHNRLGKFAEQANLINDIIARIEKFYDYVFIDEVQDLGGHDFNFIMSLTKASVNYLFVGDFYQNTYVTSRDGNVNSTLYTNYKKFIKIYEANKITIDTETLIRSYRCSMTICNYISEKLKIKIESHRIDKTELKLIENINEINEILKDNFIVKLVYDKSSQREYYSKNWGECKGEDDFLNTCIILNKKTFEHYKKDSLDKLPPLTKNKLYVALSRTNGNCYLIEEDSINNPKKQLSLF